MLDLDLTFDALADDILNTSQIYAVRLKPSMIKCIPVPVKINGHKSIAEGSGMCPADNVHILPPTQINGKMLQPKITNSKLCEETVRDTFSIFGTVESVLLPAKPGKRARHAYISKSNSHIKL